MDTSYYRRPPWRQARWIIAAVTIATLALIAALILTTGGTTSHHGARKAAVQACATAVTDGTIPTAPPGDVQWKSVGEILVPISATFGPTRYDGPVWGCYAHNPVGAVMAAYDIFAGLASPDWHVVADHEVVPGQGLRAYIAASESQPYKAPAPGQILQPVGFEILTYTPEQATIEALSAAGGDQYQASEYTVAWYDGDWKMVLTPNGGPGPDPQLVTSTNGFVLWGETSG